jgi:hypothetical protein
MSIHTNAHGGGQAGRSYADDSGNDIVVPDTGRRRYLFVQASRANTGVVFLRMHPTEPAEVEHGIPLYPGDWHEWTWDSMYWGPIRAAAETGTIATIYWHEGR